MMMHMDYFYDSIDKVENCNKSISVGSSTSGKVSQLGRIDDLKKYAHGIFRKQATM